MGICGLATIVFKETWIYQIFPILCYLGVKLTIVAKPQIPNDIPF